MRKKVARQAIGKQSNFRLRGKPIDVDDIVRYFKRKGIPNPEAMGGNEDASTPSNLSCWTPSPTVSSTRSPTPQITELPNQDEEALAIRPVNDQPGEDIHDNITNQNGLQAPHQADRYAAPTEVYPIQVDQILDLLSYGMQTSQMRRSPSPPIELIAQHMLFHNIRDYLRGAHETGLFLQFEQPRLAMVKSTRGDGDLGRFSNLWATGNQLMTHGLFVEGRRVFTKVSKVIFDILRSADPGSLSHLLEMQYEIDKKHPQLAAYLRTYSDDVVKMMYPEGHPWRGLISALAVIDRKYLREALLRSWQIANEELRSSMGQYDPGYLNSYTQFVVVVQDAVDMERTLRHMVQESQPFLPKPDYRYLRLRCEHAWSLFHRGDYAAALVASDELAMDAWTAGSKGFEIDCLRLSGTCHYRLGNPQDAEMFMKEAIKKL